MLMILLQTLIRRCNGLIKLVVGLSMLAAMLPGVTYAQTEMLSAKSAKFTGERPGAGGAPTDVHIGLFVIDVGCLFLRHNGENVAARWF